MTETKPPSAEGASSVRLTRAPKGRGVYWMRRIANVGFGLAVCYFIYLVVILVLSAKNNAEIEGQNFGDIQVEFVANGAGATVATEATLETSPVWSAELRRKQIVVLWATWCGPCHSLLMDLKDGVSEGKLDSESLVAVSIAEPLKDVSAYLQKTPLPFRVALDREGALARRFKLSGTPTVVFVSEDGIIQKVTTGGFGLSRKVSEFLK